MATDPVVQNVVYNATSGALPATLTLTNPVNRQSKLILVIAWTGTLSTVSATQNLTGGGTRSFARRFWTNEPISGAMFVLLQLDWPDDGAAGQTINISGGTGGSGRPTIVLYEVAGLREAGTGVAAAYNSYNGSAQNVEMTTDAPQFGINAANVPGYTFNAASAPIPLPYDPPGTAGVPAGAQMPTQIWGDDVDTFVIGIGINSTDPLAAPTGGAAYDVSGSQQGGNMAWVVDAQNTVAPPTNYNQTICHARAKAGTLAWVDFGAAVNGQWLVAMITFSFRPPAWKRQSATKNTRADANSFWANQNIFARLPATGNTIIAAIAGYQASSVSQVDSTTGAVLASFTKVVEDVDTATFEYYGASIWVLENFVPSTGPNNFTIVWANNYPDMQTNPPQVWFTEIVGEVDADITATQDTASPSTDLIVETAGPSNGRGIAVAVATSRGASHVLSYVGPNNTIANLGTFPATNLLGVHDTLDHWDLGVLGPGSATYPNAGVMTAIFSEPRQITANFKPTLATAGNYHAVMAVFITPKKALSVDVNAVELTADPYWWIDDAGVWWYEVTYGRVTLDPVYGTWERLQDPAPKVATYQITGTTETDDAVFAGLVAVIATNEGLTLTYTGSASGQGNPGLQAGTILYDPSA